MIRHISSLRLNDGTVYSLGEDITEIVESDSRFFLKKNGLVMGEIDKRDVDYVEYKHGDKMDYLAAVLRYLKSAYSYTALSQEYMQEAIKRLEENNGSQD